MSTLPWGSDPVADIRQERLQSSAELRRLLGHFELVQRAPAAYLLVDAQGTIFKVNEAAIELFGLEPAQLLDGSLSDVAANDAHLPLFTCLDETISTGQLHEHSSQLRDARHVRWSLHPLASQGDGAEYCLVSCHIVPEPQQRVEEPLLSGDEPPVSYEYFEDVGVPLSAAEPGTWSDSGVLVRPAHLLIADHNAERRAELMDILEPLGVTAIGADNGAEALEKLKAHHFDGVIIDLHLPVLNGFETVEWIRRDPALQHLKVLALTTGAFRHEEDASYAAGCDLFQTMPCKAEELLARVQSLLTSIEAAHDIYDQRSYS